MKESSHDSEKPDIDKTLSQLNTLAWILDANVNIPGTKLRLGIDSLVGLIPGVGDSLTAVISLYFVVSAHRLGVPLSIKIKMISNILIDLVVGAIPIAGDIFDMYYKANIRNVELLKSHFQRF